ncbi:hypothetical protein CYMTET_26011 [Cymbomonas tetramitiformis]|uniref:Uncharacterized protein n=1 Tax=Cymbomonas tetramitiformis TaxID=36881 RepID=A0AAE0FTG3_9CHLO|nr:hypothetical protein CYMTET_26011 [Cymbomonas tetramitiformis]
MPGQQIRCPPARAQSPPCSLRRDPRQWRGLRRHELHGRRVRPLLSYGLRLERTIASPSHPEDYVHGIFVWSPDLSKMKRRAMSVLAPPWWSLANEQDDDMVKSEILDRNSNMPGTIGTQELVLHKYQLVYMDEKDKTWIQGYPGLGSGASTGMQASGEGEDTLHLDAASETANELQGSATYCLIKFLKIGHRYLFKLRVWEVEDDEIPTEYFVEVCIPHGKLASNKGDSADANNLDST